MGGTSLDRLRGHVRGAVGRGARRLEADLAFAKCAARAAATRLTGEEEGQGTTEYAVLVGVLVIIAIAAIIAFRGKIQELWDAIANGINGL